MENCACAVSRLSTKIYSNELRKQFLVFMAKPSAVLVTKYHYIILFALVCRRKNTKSFQLQPTDFVARVALDYEVKSEQLNIYIKSICNIPPSAGPPMQKCFVRITLIKQAMSMWPLRKRSLLLEVRIDFIHLFD